MRLEYGAENYLDTVNKTTSINYRFVCMRFVRTEVVCVMAETEARNREK